MFGVKNVKISDFFENEVRRFSDSTVPLFRGINYTPLFTEIYNIYGNLHFTLKENSLS